MYDNREIVKFEGRREGGLRMHSIFATLNSSKKSMFAIIRLQCRIAHIFFSSTYTRFFLLRSACQWCNFFFFSRFSFVFFFFFFSPLESNHVLPCRTSSRQYKGSNFYLLNGKKKNINCNSPHSMYMCMPKCRFVHIIIASGSLPTF